MKLPIDALLPRIVDELNHGPNLVIEAPPGAGKTTRVPPALLDGGRGEVLVLEPRRLAARLAARRVASELGERVGETVGYQVRFEDVSGPRTRLRFLTEGVLTRRLLSDPTLTGVGAVILDEFHERHLETDLALALLRRLQQTKSDLKLIVMSATLDAAPIAKYLGGCPILRSEGKLYDLAIEYTPHSPAPLEEQVTAALERLVRAGLTGNVLAFLPGAAEIRRAARAVDPLASRLGLLVLPLHGDLSPAEQDRAVSPADRPKIILSTNVAESSVTIEGVTAVIDSGLARVAADSPWTGLPSVEVRRISQASATQRAGRAGRTAPGRAIRLYSAEDFHRRLAADTPEIVRRELSQLVLQLRTMGITGLQWLDRPPDAAFAAANALLDRLGMTPEMAELPLPPRLAKLVLAAKSKGVPEKGCAVAAVLSAGERGSSDLLSLTESDWQPQTRRIFDQLRKKISGRDLRNQGDAAILQSILAAFPDRVARHRRGRSNDDELLLSSGGSARFPNCRWEFLVAIDIEERPEHGLPLVRLAAPIEPEWLLERAVERISLEWNRAAERVEQVTALVYDQLVIEESRAPAAASVEASRLLAQKALEAGIGRFADPDAVEQVCSRAAFGGIMIDAKAVLVAQCESRTTFEQLEASVILAAMRPARIQQAAPERIKLPGGREVQVHYESGKPPWIESRLQDFFGMRDTPRIGGAPVVVHLLAPNRRPVQVTSDLAGFWDRLYPQVRKELARRYPKHKWPEKPV
jgi:ATP-dependent helicase HrpB